MHQDECRRFSLYLLGEQPAPRTEALYAQALVALKLDADAPLTAFVARHPWALGPVDAACALLRPNDLLRRRLLALTAILETTPQAAGKFMPRVTSPAGFATGFFILGLIATLRLATGLVLWPFIARLKSPATDPAR